MTPMPPPENPNPAGSAGDPVPRVRLSGPGELLALIPYLLGFHPSDSLVSVGLRNDQVAFTLRVDLPPPGGAFSSSSVDWLVSTLSGQALTGIVLVGYGGSAQVGPPMAALAAALHTAAVPLVDRLRVCDHRFWSYDCADPTCCPPTGRSFAAEHNRIAAEAAYVGLVALPDRADLESRVAPVGGPHRVAMERARHAADLRRQSIVDSAVDADTATGLLVLAGTVAVHDALQRYQSSADANLTDDEVAWLALSLHNIDVRDAAWRRCDKGDLNRHRALWTDVTRRAPRRDVAPPAALLGYVCWQQGDGALAGIALSRALSADPRYQMAGLLLQVIAAGMPPESWRVADSDHDTVDEEEDA